MNLYLVLALALALLVTAYVISVLRRVQTQLMIIKNVLEDIKNGNLNRRILAKENDMTRQICFDINEIAVSSQTRLIQQQQSEQAYKRLMASLSHDVKTPLASLVGYLEAVESKIVMGEEKDEYIRVASEKAHNLKSFVEKLFEWVKLDSGEQVFFFESCDMNELSRNIIADWVPVLENHHSIRIDINAYTRILNNLLQNIMIHSEGDRMSLRISENEKQAQIMITDNGKGISSDDLPHIFERMYRCDHSRSGKGNGLGLSIVKELVTAHKGRITVNSVLGSGTTFMILLPKAL